jgi:nuclear-control-of-ATPase protein 2
MTTRTPAIKVPNISDSANHCNLVCFWHLENKMGGFVTEQVNALNNTLYRAFSESIKERPRRSSLSDMNEAVRTGDTRKFLSLASEAIDLSGSSLPTPETLQRYLKMYQELPKGDSEDKALELLLVAKCTFALHGIIQENLLDSTVPLSQSIQYWNRVHGNWGRESYYALQSRFWPQRLDYLHDVRMLMN